MKKRVLYTVMTIFYVVIFCIIAMPFGTKLVDRVEPHILGLPCYQACIFYGSLLMAVGLIVWFLIECKIEDSEAEKEGITTEEVNENVK